MQTAFIGGGVMAEAMFSRALAQHIAMPSQVIVAEPVAARRQALEQTYAIKTCAANAEAASHADLVVLAVKPQHFGAVAKELKGSLRKGQAVMSIMAGVPLQTLTSGLGHDEVIRVMPNTPAQVGAGVAVWIATPAVAQPARDAAARLLAAMGREFQVAEEKYLDIATAVSGSGPAYVFAFIESLIDAAVYLGLARDVATTMVVETVLGSALLAKQSGQHPGLLREMVTSPGGTTAEALLVLEQRGFAGAVMDAVIAAHKKSQHLGEKS